MAGALIEVANRRIWRISPRATHVGCAIAIALIMACGALLIWRRIAGNALGALPIALLLGTACGAAGIVRICQTACRPASSGRHVAPRWGQSFTRWGGTASLLSLAVGCSYPGDRLVDWVVWLPLISFDAWRRHAPQQQPRGNAGQLRRDSRTNRVEPQQGSYSLAGTHPLTLSCEVGGRLDDAVLQEVRRIRNADGVEAIAGTLRAEFAAGQRHAILHVGFCPPLSHLPLVEAEAGDGPEAEVRVVQAFAHGARLEVRLSKPAVDQCSVLVELSASPQLDGDFNLAFEQ